MSYPAPPPRPRSNAGGMAAALSAMGVVLLVTIVSFIVAHTGSTAESATAGVQGVPGNSSLPAPTGSALRPSGVPSSGTDVPTSDVPTSDQPTSSVPTYTPPTTRPYSPPPVYLNPAQVNSALKSFFDGFVYHNLGQVRQVVCPKYLSYYQGTYINGNEISRWQSRATTLPAGQRQVAIFVAADLRNPNTGAAAGEYNHSWVVQLESNGRYYVCGYTV